MTARRGGPMISVIIPLYNMGAHIERCLRSVRQQTVQDFELLVVDDGSTDNGPDLVPTYLRDGDRLIRQTNAGVSVARNQGVAEMKGQIAAFLDADDEWLPDHLERVNELAERFPDAGLLATGYTAIYHGGLAVRVSVASSEPIMLENYLRMSVGRHFLCPSAFAVRRSALTQHGGFLPGEACWEDVEFLARLSLVCRFACHPSATAVYHREHADRATVRRVRDAALPLPVRVLLQRVLGDDIHASSRDDVLRYARGLLEYVAVMEFAEGASASAVTALIEDPLVRRTGVRPRLRLFRTAMHAVPARLLRLYLRFKRSRWCTPRLAVRDGIVVRKVTV